MVTTRARKAIYGAIGLSVGYLIWLGATAIVVATTPVGYWVLSVAVILAVLTSGAVTFAMRNRRDPLSAAFWCAPILPTVVSLYLLVVIAT